MVNKLFDNAHFLGYKEAKKMVSSYMNKNLANCILIDDQNYGMAFFLSFKGDNIQISLTSDRGDLTYTFNLNGEAIDLNSFEPLLKNLEWFSQKNILFLLSTIKRFLTSQTPV